MNIRDRKEGEKLQQGVQVTQTPVADYFYFVAKDRLVSVRVPHLIRIPEDIKVEQIWPMDDDD